MSTYMIVDNVEPKGPDMSIEGLSAPDHPDNDDENELASDEEVDALVNDVSTDAPVETGEDENTDGAV